MTKVFTHTDLDGFGAGFLLELRYRNCDFEIEYVNYNNIEEKVREYLKTMCEYDIGYITDISISDELCQEIENSGREFVLLDHHINSGTDHLDKYRWCIRQGYDDEGKPCSATWLVNRYITKFEENFIQDVVFNINDYDTWSYVENGNKTAKHFNEILYMVGRERFTDMLMKQYFSGNEFFILDKNVISVLKYKEEEYKKYLEKLLKKVTLHKLGEYKVAVVFAERFISELGNDIYDEYANIVDFVIIINMQNNTVSLRGGDGSIHLGEIAKKFGGGGHKASAGFSLVEDFINDVIGKILIL